MTPPEHKKAVLVSLLTLMVLLASMTEPPPVKAPSAPEIAAQSVATISHAR